MLAAVDGITFTTEALARGYSLTSSDGMVLGKAADIEAFERLAPAGRDDAFSDSLGGQPAPA